MFALAFYYILIPGLLLWLGLRLEIFSTNRLPKLLAGQSTAILGTISLASSTIDANEEHFPTQPKLKPVTHRTPLDNSSYASRVANYLDICAEVQCESNIGMLSMIPKIILLGNRGVGKSSLINAITQLRIMLEEEPPMLCPIEIRLRRGVRNQADCLALVGIGQPPKLFEKTTRMEELPDILRRARIRVLRPTIYITGDLASANTGVAFSDRIIIVEIEGAAVDIDLVEFPDIHSVVIPYIELILRAKDGRRNLEAWMPLLTLESNLLLLTIPLEDIGVHL